MAKEGTDIIWTYIKSKTAAEMKKVIWTYVEDPSEIERTLVQWNILHFNQASETPLTTPQWKQLLDPCNRSDSELDEILHHRLTEDANLDPETRCFLTQIQNNIQSPMPKSRTILTEKTFRDFYRKTPEDESASPSGLHIGHYKTTITNHDFLYVVWQIMSLSYTNSYCLKRWRTSATTLLEKMHGNPMDSQV